MKDLVLKNLRENIFLTLKILNDNFAEEVIRVSNKIIEAYKKNNKLLLAGNGGSAADAQHIAGELVDKFYEDRIALSAISLNTDTSVLTAWANDISFDLVFERQIEAHGNQGDVFLVISTSGNSENLIKASLKAKEKGLIVIGLLGREGGKLKELCDYSLIVPGEDVARIQEVQKIVYHTICQLIERAFLK